MTAAVRGGGMIAVLSPLILSELRAQHMHRALPDALAMDTSLRDDLGMDDLDYITVAMAIEAALGIDVPDPVAFAWQSVGDAVRWVERVCGAEAGA